MATIFGYTLTTNGLNFSADKRWIKVVNVSFLCYSMALMISTTISIVIEMTNGVSYAQIDDLIWQLFAFYMYSILWKNRKEIIDFRSSLERLSINIDKKRLLYTEIVYNVYHWSTFLLYLICWIILADKLKFTRRSFLIVKTGSPILTTIENTFYDIAYYLNDRLAPLLTLYYLLILENIYMVKIDFIDSIEQLIVCSNDQRFEWREIVKLTDRFEQLFNFAPFLKFGQTFVQTVIYLIFSLENNKMATIVYYAIAHYVFDACLTLYLILLISKWNQRLKLKISTLIDQSMSTRCPNKLKLIGDIEKQAPFNLTAHGMFSLDKSVILGFCSNLVTFTVLIIQLFGFDRKN